MLSQAKEAINSIILSPKELKELSDYCLAKKKEVERNTYKQYTIRFQATISNRSYGLNNSRMMGACEELFDKRNWKDYLQAIMSEVFKNLQYNDIPIRFIRVSIDKYKEYMDNYGKYDFEKDNYQISGEVSWKSLGIDNTYLTHELLLSQINIISDDFFYHEEYNCRIKFDSFELVQ